MVAALYTLYYINSAFLILVVLLQSGRGGGLGEFGGGGGASTTFGSRGASTILQRLTVYSAVGFMVLSITLAIISSKQRDAGRGEIVAEEQMDPAIQDQNTDGEDAPGMLSDEPEAEDAADDAQDPAGLETQEAEQEPAENADENDEDEE